MSLAPLFNIPRSPEELAVFAFVNMDQHRQIVDALNSQHNISVPLYPLDPIPADLATWARNHQDLHSAFTQILGIQGSDLTAVNFRDPSELASWIFIHAVEHQQAADKLRLN